MYEKHASNGCIKRDCWIDNIPDFYESSHPIFFAITGFIRMSTHFWEAFARPWQTSTGVLLKHIDQSAQSDPDFKIRLAMASEINVAVRGFSKISKVTGLVGFCLALAVLCWPLLVYLDFFKGLQPETKALVPTTLSAIAAYTLTVHRQYKERQTFAERIMRSIAFSEGPIKSLLREAQKIA
ncbi:MAG: hypothetical protein AAF986_10935, partial [Pseudomonadota bacterium]